MSSIVRVEFQYVNSGGTVTFTIAGAANDLMTAIGEWYPDPGAGNISISDNVNTGNYVLDKTWVFNNTRFGIFHIVWNASGTPKVTVSSGGGLLVAAHYNGFVHTPTMLFGTDYVSSTGTGTAVNSGSFNTSQSGEQVYALFSSVAGTNPSDPVNLVSGDAEYSFNGGYQTRSYDSTTNVPNGIAAGIPASYVTTMSTSDTWYAAIFGFYDAPPAPTLIVNGSGLQSFANVTSGNAVYFTTWSVAAGNTLIVQVVSTDSNNAGDGIGINGLADQQGTYTQDEYYQPYNHYALATFSLLDTIAGVHNLVLTMSPNAAAYGSYVVVELEGLWTFDKLLGSNTATSTTPSVTGGTPTAKDFQLAIYSGQGVNNEPSLPSGWTGSYMGIPPSGWPSSGFVWAYSSAAQGATSWGTLGASDTWASMIVGYEPLITQTLTMAYGSFALTGIAVAFSLSQIQSLSILVNPGAFNWTGAQSVSNYVIQNASGSFALTGEPVTLTTSIHDTYTLPISPGLFALTGENVVLQTWQYIFPVFSGTFTLTGENVAFSQAIAPPGYIYMPNLVGMDWLEASYILYIGGFAELNPSIVKGPQAKKGIVVGQAPAAETIIKDGTAVELTVVSDHLLAVSFESPSV